MPDWFITIVFGARVRTREIKLSRLGGRDMVGRSNPSPSQSLCWLLAITFAYKGGRKTHVETNTQNSIIRIPRRDGSSFDGFLDVNHRTCS